MMWATARAPCPWGRTVNGRRAAGGTTADKCKGITVWRIGEGLGDEDAVMEEIDAGGRSLQTTAVAFG
jgi:hypothetical protein